MSIRFWSLTCQSTPAVRRRQRSKNMRAASVPQIPTPHLVIVNAAKYPGYLANIS